MELQQLLLWCGAIAGPLFILVFIVEGALRPGYNPSRQAVSALSQGPRGWIQQANFFVSGVLMFAYAYGLYLALATLGGSSWGPILVALEGVGLIGAGIFVTDVSGAPLLKRSAAGLLHDVFSVIVFASVFSACFVLAHIFTIAGSQDWSLYSKVTGTIYGIGFFVFASAFSPRSPLSPIGGLLQRLTIIVGWIWLSALAIHLLQIL